MHPQVALEILRHAQFALPIEIYALASFKATRDALKRLDETLDSNPSLYFAAEPATKAPPDDLGKGLGPAVGDTGIEPVTSSV